MGKTKSWQLCRQQSTVNDRLLLLQVVLFNLFMPRIQRGELVNYEPEIEHTLRSVCHTLRFETTNNNAIILIEKMEEEMKIHHYRFLQVTHSERGIFKMVGLDLWHAVGSYPSSGSSSFQLRLGAFTGLWSGHTILDQLIGSSFLSSPNPPKSLNPQMSPSLPLFPVSTLLHSPREKKDFPLKLLVAALPRPAQISATSAIPSFLDRLSPANKIWIPDRQFLNVMVEKSFDEHMTEHLGLGRDLASILGIRDEGNIMVTIDSNRMTIQDDPDWTYEATSNQLQIVLVRETGGPSFTGMTFSNFYPEP
ncbi:hypothetical protein M9H77_26795 [Catharanthus roseus]|uniref:Uncharacterized protein n=1 Tax=Catharanthus roseus TaxID=4058 RepID=A0ACC0AAM3_CATRO|nr:hypothetical protein M9H77_26795 [Catharanthus roseus]